MEIMNETEDIYILGVSAFYHDAAAALLKNGKILFAAQEERFNRKKHYSGFPVEAIRFCLKEAGIPLSRVNYFVFYEKPFIKFERLLETYLSYAPSGIRSFLTALPAWLNEKIYIKSIIKKELLKIDPQMSVTPPILFGEHHQSHAASAFFPSPFQKAAVLCMDGVGEWATTTAWMGEDNRIKPLWEIKFPHSIGLLYSAFTYYTGFRVNSGEYKVMGLAPYGQPKYVKQIYDNLLDLKEDGTFRMNMEYFNYCTGLTMTNDKFHKLFGAPPRKPESKLTQREMDLARSIQEVSEEAMLRLARTLHKETGAENLCMAGGVALNCVANGRVLREGPFKNIWIQPAAGDSGGALGAALAAWHEHLDKPRQANGVTDSMQGSFLGPVYSNDQIEASLKAAGAVYKRVDDDRQFFDEVAGILASEKVIGWFQGRMEFGPRALGGRSILGDARSTKMQSVMNLKIKYRESFRPFAPSVLRERVSDYFELNSDSPYMLIVAPVAQSRRKAMGEKEKSLWGIDLLNVPRSDIPAVTHVDYSARVQTVTPESNPRYYKLLKAFEQKTGYGVLVNTSYNVRGEPIVCTPEDAYRCFMRTEMDALILENCILLKENQPALEGDTDWKKEYELD